MFAYHFPTQRGAESFVNGNLALVFLESDVDIDVITLDSSGSDIPSDLSDCWLPLKPVTHFVPDKATGFFANIIERVLKVFSPVHLTSYLFWVWNAVILGNELKRKNGHYDFVMSRCQPMWSHIPALVVSAIWKTPWVANWNDPAPIRKYPKPLGEGKTPPLPVGIGLLFRTICTKASWHTFVCERLKNYMWSYMPETVKNKSTVIPHISCSRMLKRGSQNQGRFTLCHAGSAYYRNWARFLEGIKLFGTGHEVRGLFSVEFIGWQPDEFTEYVRKLGLDDIVVEKPARIYQEFVEDLAASDVLVVIEMEAEEGIFLPSKVADYVTVGRPILAVSPKTGTMADLLSRFGGGVVADCASPEKIAEGIELLYESWQSGRLQLDFDTGRLKKLFSKSTVVSQYQELFKHIRVGRPD
jgi:hypothetical protein